jgi:hypothetical protein
MKKHLRNRTRNFNSAISILWGDLSPLRGDMSMLRGVVQGLRGDATGVCGDVTGITGDLDQCDLTPADRAAGVDIRELVK